VNPSQSTTDFHPELARNRCRTFKEKTCDALVSLKQIFHYHFIKRYAVSGRAMVNTEDSLFEDPAAITC